MHLLRRGHLARRYPASFYESSVYDAVSRHNDRYYRAFSYLMRTSFDDAIKQFSDSSISSAAHGRLAFL